MQKEEKWTEEKREIKEKTKEKEESFFLIERAGTIEPELNKREGCAPRRHMSYP
ncbi:hypothetical protein HYW76_01875 [Candidatus Pacearchaeota archaeon]|nr:hypothetical protein [Candidatus Pacearchaeota archaeon]